MKTLKQIIKEFSLPLLLAFLWILYNLKNTAWSVADAVNIFGTTFFLVSWLCGQYFRIRKQNKVESEFDKVQVKLNNFFAQLETKTENIIDNLTGGNSFCYWLVTNINADNDGLEVISHEGKYPLFNI